MDEEECIHIPGVPVSQCVICNGKAKEEDDRVKVSYSFPATYIALLKCGHFSTIGEPIAALSDGRFVCEECGEDY